MKYWTVAGLALSALLACAGVHAKGDSDMRVVRNITYGADARQRFDAYIPAKPTGQVILMVHSEGWARGDKAQAAQVQSKVRYWVQKGYVMLSTNTRLLPKASVMEQAKDLARALAKAQSLASSWGADPKRFALMGHSSGAHLVMLLNAAPQIARAEGAQPWRAAVSLDNASINVPAVMQRPHPPMYDRAFGKNPADWERVSPLHIVDRGAPPLLMVCSRREGDNCDRALEFEKKAALLYQQSIVIWQQDISHADISAALGKPGPYANSVSLWINSIL